MSIFYICGKPGGGKSYVGVKQICEELADPKSDRFIVTNIALNMPNLAEWCHKHCKHEVNLQERIRILDDAQCGEFWLYEPHYKFEKRRTLDMGRRKMDVPDFEERAKRGCLYVIDEVHVYFGARDWQATGSDATFFLSQHRKLQCDVILITQHPEQTDKALRRLAQEYMSMRNLAREPVLGFRLGNFFRYVRTLNSPQSPNPAVFETGFVSLKPEEIGKLYDTTAGVGIAGRVTPRSEKRGRSVWWLVPIVLSFIIAFVLFVENFHRLSDAFNFFLRKAFVRGQASMTSALHLSVSPPSLNTGHSVKLAPASNVSEVFTQTSSLDTNSLFCTGWIYFDRNIQVFMSDGSTFDSRSGDVTVATRRYVVVGGKRYSCRQIFSSTNSSVQSDISGIYPDVSCLIEQQRSRFPFPQVSVAEIGQSWSQVSKPSLEGVQQRLTQPLQQQQTLSPAPSSDSVAFGFQ